MKNRFSATNSQGFTILELMIATTVFSVILLISTIGIVYVGRIYYKGKTIIRTQNVTRSVTDSISQSIQYGGSDAIGTLPDIPAVIPVTGATFCIGNSKYTYSPNRVTSTTFGLILDANNSSGCTPASVAAGGKELLGDGMRLTRFIITKSSTSDYTIKISVGYGADDVLVGGKCVLGAGGQFCATSILDTTVRRRLK